MRVYKQVTTMKRPMLNNLLVAIENSEHIKEDDRVVVLKDLYPKAQFHYLVVPKIDIDAINHVKKENEDLLNHMADVAKDLTKEHKDSEFLMGYHAQPSCRKLHLHVISTDFNSPCLKTKRHWNSFTTPFFLHSEDICKQLREKGELKMLKSEEYENYLKTPLRCHKCSLTPRNMPQLKKHLLSHLPEQKRIV